MDTTPEKPPRIQNEAKQREPPAIDSYNRFADTIGGVPSLRLKDTLIQGIASVVCAVVGALVGLLAWGPIGLVFCGLAGLVLGVFGYGFVMMIQGWRRSFRKK